MCVCARARVCLSPTIKVSVPIYWRRFLRNGKLGMVNGFLHCLFTSFCSSVMGRSFRPFWGKNVVKQCKESRERPSVHANCTFTSVRGKTGLQLAERLSPFPLHSSAQKSAWRQFFVCFYHHFFNHGFLSSSSHVTLVWKICLLIVLTLYLFSQLTINLIAVGDAEETRLMTH